MDYTYDKGFCRHMIGNEGDQESAICIKLAQQTILNNIRLLLWDKDDRNVQNIFYYLRIQKLYSLQYLCCTQ